MKPRTLLVLGLALIGSASGNDQFRARGEVILKEIVAMEWAEGWKDATLENVRLVAQKPDLAEPTGLPPVWYARIEGPGKKNGYLVWDSGGEGKLVEFAFDEKLEFQGKGAKAISGVPGLQEFPIKGEDGKLVASGCVPTAGASAVAFWIENGFPQWRGKKENTPKELALRLRSRMDMALFPDADGFSENRMALAGAYPSELVNALRDDARAHGVEVAVELKRFSMEAVKTEVSAGRPSMVSCTVRVAHKPELSWPHEVVAVGFTKLDGVELVGVVDNFFPTKHPETIRWIRKDAFRSIITLRPRKGAGARVPLRKGE